MCLRNEDQTAIGIATAYHVVEHADKWQQPLRIRRPGAKLNHFVPDSIRAILTDPITDSAVILIFVANLELDLPKSLIQLLPLEKSLPIGVEVGWLGYPSMVDETLCFFAGNISAKMRSSYLIDGVAINGVSGGPVLYSTGTDGLQIVGSISAYLPNSAGSGSPGLSIAQDVSHFNNTALYMKSVDEARRQKVEMAAAISTEAKGDGKGSEGIE